MDRLWAILQPGVTMGEGAIISVRGVIIKDVKPNTIIAGVPASAIGKLDVNK